MILVIFPVLCKHEIGRQKLSSNPLRLRLNIWLRGPETTEGRLSLSKSKTSGEVWSLLHFPTFRSLQDSVSGSLLEPLQFVEPIEAGGSFDQDGLAHGRVVTPGKKAVQRHGVFRLVGKDGVSEMGPIRRP